MKSFKNKVLLALMLLFFFQPAFAALPSLPNSDFIDNDDGTVTHKTTGLTWMRCLIGQTWQNGDCFGEGSELSYEQAMALTSNFAGKSDWRLPDIDELVSVMSGSYRANDKEFVFNSTIFPRIPKNSKVKLDRDNLPAPARIWSATPSPNDGGKAAVYMITTSRATKSIDYPQEDRDFVLLVRGGHWTFGSSPLPLTATQSEQVGKQEHEAADLKARKEQEKARKEQEEATRYALEEHEREAKIQNFRKHIKEGDDTSAGVVIEVKGNLVKIQTNESQCTQRDYKDNCRNYVNTPAEKWLKRSEVYPQ